jgi:hypothetical protein
MLKSGETMAGDDIVCMLRGVNYGAGRGAAAAAASSPTAEAAEEEAAAAEAARAKGNELFRERKYPEVRPRIYSDFWRYESHSLYLV